MKRSVPSSEIDKPALPSKRRNRLISAKKLGLIAEREIISYKKSRGRWVCDVCKVVTFPTFEEACAHEEACRGKQQQQVEEAPKLTEQPEPHQPSAKKPAKVVKMSKTMPILPMIVHANPSRREEIWTEKFKHAKAFYEENGHLRISRTSPEYPNLKQWLSYQRRQYKSLRKDQLERLESINYNTHRSKTVTTKVNEENWQSKFEKLKQYHRTKGDCNVPVQWKEDVSLGAWVSNQRKSYIRMKTGGSYMNPDRIQKLEQLGFEWSFLNAARSNAARSNTLEVPPEPQPTKKPAKVVKMFKTMPPMIVHANPSRREEVWTEKFKQAKAFYEENGHLRISRTYHPKYPNLRQWLEYQRHVGAKSLRKDQLERLESIDYKNVRLHRDRDEWEVQFEKLKQYHRTKGDCNVPMHWKEDVSLRAWVSEQRKRYIRMKTGESYMHPGQIQKLEQLGFEWPCLNAARSNTLEVPPEPQPTKKPAKVVSPQAPYSILKPKNATAAPNAAGNPSQRLVKEEAQEVKKLSDDDREDTQQLLRNEPEVKETAEIAAKTLGSDLDEANRQLVSQRSELESARRLLKEAQQEAKKLSDDTLQLLRNEQEVKETAEIAAKALGSDLDEANRQLVSQRSELDSARRLLKEAQEAKKLSDDTLQLLRNEQEVKETAEIAAKKLGSDLDEANRQLVSQRSELESARRLLKEAQEAKKLSDDTLRCSF
jgi:translation initiation factor 2 alpha subunit (eIF-2alpha)